MKRIVVTGGRDYENSAMVYDILSFLNPDEVYFGDCPTGVDKYVKMWCEENISGLFYKEFKADWTKHGRSAGPIRNREMLVAAGSNAVTVAFPGGKGTKDCVNQSIVLCRMVMEVI